MARQAHELLVRADGEALKTHEGAVYMKYTVTLGGAVDFAPANETAEILQNVRTILTTLIGSVPMYRVFGLDWELIDIPYPVARALVQSAVIEAIESYEPRARVESVTFDETVPNVMDGILRPRVIVSIGEEEDE